MPVASFVATGTACGPPYGHAWRERGSPPLKLLPFPSALYLKEVCPPGKKRPDECPAVPAKRGSHPQRRGSCRSPLRFHFSYRPDSFPFLSGGPAVGHGHHATPTTIHLDKMHLGKEGALGGPFAWAKGPPLPGKRPSASPPSLPALSTSHGRMVKNAFPHPVPARRLSRVPE